MESLEFRDRQRNPWIRRNKGNPSGFRPHLILFSNKRQKRSCAMQACGTTSLCSAQDDRLHSVILSEAKDLHILVEKSIRCFDCSQHDKRHYAVMLRAVEASGRNVFRSYLAILNLASVSARNCTGRDAGANGINDRRRMGNIKTPRLSVNGSARSRRPSALR